MTEEEAKQALAHEFVEALNRLRDRCVTVQGLRAAAERRAWQVVFQSKPWRAPNAS